MGPRCRCIVAMTLGCVAIFHTQLFLPGSDWCSCSIHSPSMDPRTDAVAYTWSTCSRKAGNAAGSRKGANVMKPLQSKCAWCAAVYLKRCDTRRSGSAAGAGLLLVRRRFGERIGFMVGEIHACQCINTNYKRFVRDAVRVGVQVAN